MDKKIQLYSWKFCSLNNLLLWIPEMFRDGTFCQKVQDQSWDICSLSPNIMPGYDVSPSLQPALFIYSVANVQTLVILFNPFCRKEHWFVNLTHDLIWRTAEQTWEPWNIFATWGHPSFKKNIHLKTNRCSSDVLWADLVSWRTWFSNMT